ncbi:hypothetical protein Bpfe_006237 [Biomphalaria pfeifferi]|uniref:Uncharacterized protein n=1 Tax=Biomphalaria pfeifferi TaxID=112525 RepID=A0AAD8FHY1_BIOPF|nr:hypothetical protein Bpfe_006237 [Biomphalaria pfeifferi]
MEMWGVPLSVLGITAQSMGLTTTAQSMAFVVPELTASKTFRFKVESRTRNSSSRRARKKGRLLDVGTSSRREFWNVSID